MSVKEKTVGKLYWSIGEVAAELGVNSSLIRYWEKEFDGITPRRTGRGDRLYTRKDIEFLARIKHLVKEQGFTLHGAREQLRQKEAPKEDPAPATTASGPAEVKERLLAIRAKLIDLRAGLEETAPQGPVEHAPVPTEAQT